MYRRQCLKTLHLFAGAGGGLLADLILGHEPIGAAARDAQAAQFRRIVEEKTMDSDDCKSWMLNQGQCEDPYDLIEEIVILDAHGKE